MISIKLDGVLIDPESVVELKRTYQLFTDEFYLGSTACKSYSLTLSKLFTLPDTAEVFELFEDSTKVATLQLDALDDNNDRIRVYKYIDGLVKLNYYYDASDLLDSQGGTATLRQVANDICSKAGLTLSTAAFDYDSMSINFYDNTITGREYIGYIAELNGGYARVNGAGVVEFVRFSKTAKGSINTEMCDSFKLGEGHKITRVVYDNGVVKAEAGNETGDTVYINPNNVFVNGTESEIRAMLSSILARINGLEYYSVEIGKCPQPEATAGDIVNVLFNGVNYPVINKIDQYYNLGWRGGLKSSVKSSKQAETKVINSTENKIRNIRTIVDRTNGRLEIIASETTELEGNISELNNHFFVQPDGAYVSLDGGTDNAAQITYEAFNIISGGEVVMSAGKSIVQCNNGFGIKGWVIVEGSNPNVLNIMRKG